MTGIQYVTDEKGRKVAVQIDLKMHRELWEERAANSRVSSYRVDVMRIAHRREVYE